MEFTRPWGRGRRWSPCRGSDLTNILNRPRGQITAEVEACAEAATAQVAATEGEEARPGCVGGGLAGLAAQLVWISPVEEVLIPLGGEDLLNRVVLMH